MKRAAGCVVGVVLLAAAHLNATEDVSKLPEMDFRAVVSGPRPQYPAEARRKNQTGNGILVLEINRATGAVTRARIVKSTGHPILDQAAVRAFSQWRFKKGVPARMRVPITFSRMGPPPQLRR